MKTIEVHRFRLVTVAVALALAAAAFVYADRHIPPAGAALEARSANAGEVELAVIRSGLVGKLEVALGDAFGGVWFDRPTAQLHVGVTSSASLRSAEEVAAQVGLEENVTLTPVRSSWARLEVAQGRLNRHLADLFASGETRTSLSPDRNSVEVLLGSAVPTSRRSALMEEVAELGVDVSVEVTPAPRILATPKKRCNDHKEKEAYCDKPIVAGVRIESKGGEGCTAGPAVINKDRTTPAKATETFILTAGHCLSSAKGEGKGAEWFAFDRAGNKKLIGKAVDFLHGAAVKFDVGLIKVDNPGEWVNVGNIPVLPTIARWDTKETPEPFPVTAQGKKPVKGFKVCFSGQVKGTSCTEVNEPSVTEKFKTGTTVEKLVELKTAPTGFGDSGSPWFSEATPGEVYGTLVGETEGGKDIFQLLEVSFEELNAQKALDLELLTETNKARHPFIIVSEGTPTVLTGKQHGGSDAIFVDAGSVICGEATYSGEQVETEALEMSLAPAFSSCTALGFIGVPVDVNGCKYTFRPLAKEGSNFESTVDIICPEGKKIEVTAPLGCRIVIGSQSNLGSVTFTNSGSGATREVTLDIALEEVEYEEHDSNEFPCTGDTELKDNGTYEGAALVTGETAGGAHRGIWVE